MGRRFGRQQLGRQRLRCLGLLALRILLLLHLGLHRLAQPGPQRGKTLLQRRVQARQGQGLPVPIQIDQVVQRHQRLLAQRLGRADQAQRIGQRLALQHGGFEPAFGHLVDAAVLAAKVAFGLAQAVFGHQGLDGCAFDVQQRGGQRQLQQGRIVAQRGLQARRPFGLRVLL